MLPWNRGFDTYYGYLTGSELHYTKQQRTARGTPWNASQLMMYPDLRTEKGPVVDTGCITPPLAPPPPKPKPCGTQPLPPCTYHVYPGAIVAGNDIEVGTMTVAQAEAKCSANTACNGITFNSPAENCTSTPCKIYIKKGSASNSDPSWSTLTKYKRPPSGQGKTECYSTILFMKQAVGTISSHDVAGPPLFMYLAFQDVHEPVEVPQQYSDPFKATIADTTRCVA